MRTLSGMSWHSKTRRALVSKHLVKRMIQNKNVMMS